MLQIFVLVTVISCTAPPLNQTAS